MTTEEVRKIASLAKLRFADDELDDFAREFTRIVEEVGKITAVPMDNVEPLTSVNPIPNVTRHDVIGPTLSIDEALGNAPKRNEAFIKVPKVLG